MMQRRMVHRSEDSESVATKQQRSRPSQQRHDYA
jgi:hypothetical protein